MSNLVDFVNSISIAPSPHGGNIITATGTVKHGGWSNLALVQQSLQNNVLTLLFTGFPPPVQNQPSATVTATFNAPLSVIEVVVQAQNDSTAKSVYG